jgi:hypothetical protein
MMRYIVEVLTMSLWARSFIALSEQDRLAEARIESAAARPATQRPAPGPWIWLAVAAALAGLAALVLLADTGHLPAALRAWYAFPGGDKLGHIIVAAAVTLPLGLALRGKYLYLGRWALPLAALLVGALMTVEEISQASQVLRTCSWLDLAASYLGIYIAVRGVEGRRSQ